MLASAEEPEPVRLILFVLVNLFYSLALLLGIWDQMLRESP